ncbi:MAG: hypothetical protein ABW007_19285 [Chitinophagaceae bacterium]
MRTQVLTAPSDADFETFYPLAQIKADLVIASDKHNERLKRLLRAAVRVSGQAARCVILPTTQRTYFNPPVYKNDCFGLTARWIDRDRTINGLVVQGPLISITSILDGSDTVNPSLYEDQSDNSAKGTGRIGWRNPDGTPLLTRYARNPLTVEYVAGFTDPTDIATIKQAVFEIMANWHMNPGEVAEMTVQSVPKSALTILAAYWSSRTNRL